MWTWVGTMPPFNRQCWLKTEGSCGQPAPPDTAFVSGTTLPVLTNCDGSTVRRARGVHV